MRLILPLFFLACEDKYNNTTDETPSTVDPFDTPVDTDDPEEPEEPEEQTPPDNPNIDQMFNSTDSTTWVYFDLESSHIVSPESPEDSTTWDLAFQRYHIAVNGGISGTGGVEALPLWEEYDNFEAIVDIPEEQEWLTDAADADGDGKPEYAFQSWFSYDLSTHVLSPADVVYLVQTVEGNVFRVRVIDYYSAQGESGYISLEFDQL